MRNAARLLLTAATFAAGLAVSSAWSYAQTIVRAQRAPESIQPIVLSGPDVGFRVLHRGKGNTPVGTLVVRIDGEWKDVQFTFGVVKTVGR